VNEKAGTPELAFTHTDNDTKSVARFVELERSEEGMLVPVTCTDTQARAVERVIARARKVVYDSLSSAQKFVMVKQRKDDRLPTRAFFCLYEERACHGAAPHVDQNVRFATVVIKLTGIDQRNAESLTLHANENAARDYPEKGTPVRLIRGSGVIFPPMTVHSVPAVQRKKKRITMNLFF
jgi:hypothetical protein